MAEESLYDELGVAPSAEDAVIRAAYRALARSLHPDAPGGGDAERMARVNAAWTVLGDPAARAEYDLTLRDRSEPEGGSEPEEEPEAWGQEEDLAAVVVEVGRDHEPAPARVPAPERSAWERSRGVVISASVVLVAAVLAWVAILAIPAADPTAWRTWTTGDAWALVVTGALALAGFILPRRAGIKADIGALAVLALWWACQTGPYAHDARWWVSATGAVVSVLAAIATNVLREMRD